MCKASYLKKLAESLRKSDSFICSPHCYHSDLPFFEKDDIDFYSAIFGEGLYPCKKCKRDCLDNMDCINCSACATWHHFSCTKLSKSQFKNDTYFFCNKKCENSVEIPGRTKKKF